MLVLFPSDYFNHKQVDADYAAEYEAVCRIPEFKTIFYNYDGFVQGEPLKLYPDDYYTGDCIYRGWMFTPEQYATLYTKLRDKGINLINSPEQYDACHLLPNALPFIEENTPKSLCFPKDAQIDWDLVNNTFKRFMVKDYVKSVKGHDFPSCFITPIVFAEMEQWLCKFVDLRGNLFTGGFVLKEYVDFKKYGEVTNEYRAFYLKGRMLSLSRNSNQSDSCPTVPRDFVDKWANLPSNYYTVDFGELTDGSWIVIETGDGQVSGLSPGQFIFKYYDDIRAMLKEQ